MLRSSLSAGTTRETVAGRGASARRAFFLRFGRDSAKGTAPRRGSASVNVEGLIKAVMTDSDGSAYGWVRSVRPRLSGCLCAKAEQTGGEHPPKFGGPRVGPVRRRRPPPMRYGDRRDGRRPQADRRQRAAHRGCGADRGRAARPPRPAEPCGADQGAALLPAAAGRPGDRPSATHRSDRSIARTRHRAASSMASARHAVRVGVEVGQGPLQLPGRRRARRAAAAGAARHHSTSSQAARAGVDAARRRSWRPARRSAPSTGAHRPGRCPGGRPPPESAEDVPRPRGRAPRPHAEAAPTSPTGPPADAPTRAGSTPPTRPPRAVPRTPGRRRAGRARPSGAHRLHGGVSTARPG